MADTKKADEKTEYQIDKNPSSPFVPRHYDTQRDQLDPKKRALNQGDRDYPRVFFQCYGCKALVQVYELHNWKVFPCPTCNRQLVNPFTGNVLVDQLPAVGKMSDT